MEQTPKTTATEDIQHVENGASASDIKDLSKGSYDYLNMVAEAKNATATEHTMTAWEGLKRYRKAVWWSFVISNCIIWDGYDLGLTATLFALPAFQKQFGGPFQSGYQVPASWQTALALTGAYGAIIGIFVEGYLSERVGRKKVTLGAIIFLAAMISIQFCAESLPVLLVGRLMAAMPIGVFQASANTYAAEVCPMVLRAYLTSYNSLCWVIGLFICAGVTYPLSSITEKRAYKILFALQWVWALPIFLMVLFIPESPWWLVRKERYEEAEKSVQRLTDGTVNTKETVAMMIHTTQLEVEEQTGSSYWACFKGTDLRRTEIACMVYCIKNTMDPLQAYPTYYFEQAGLSTNEAFKLNLGNNALMFIATILAWPILYYFGRRTIYLTGLCVLTVFHFSIGFADIPPLSNTSADWAKSSLLIVQLFIYCATINAAMYTVVGEVGASRLRGKTVALARNFYLIFAIIIGVMTPYMLNPTAWGWGAKSAFFFGGLSCLSIVWTYFRLPELKDRTYEELDILFQKRVPARKFKGYAINAYADYDKLLAEMAANEKK